MPPYWKRYYYRRNPFRFRNRRFRTRRPRKTFRRRWSRRKRHRRTYKVKRKRFYKKRLKLTVQQFQPTSIRKCKIIGTKCLLQGSPLRCNFNYAQYANSTVPEHKPGGGGWSLMIFTLDSLYDDWLKLQNIWTESNAGLPLIRYTGCTFKFYQTEDLDYIVYYERCWPMVDTEHTHANASPTGMFLRKHKITVPSRRTQKNRKPYKKVKIKAPSQMQTHWYFQQDLCKIPLLMLTTTGVSLTYPFCSPKAKSNNITVRCLNTLLFHIPNFQTFPVTTGYYPKYLHFEHPEQDTTAYLYAHHTTNPQQSIVIDKNSVQTKQLYVLCNTKLNQEGTPTTSSSFQNNAAHWGNPFWHNYLDPDTSYIYISDMSPAELYQLKNGADQTKSYHLTLTGPMFYTYRYNPETDKGEKNQVYLVSNSSGNNWNPPSNEKLIFEGFPLYVLLWGWGDWIKKAKLTPDPDENQIVVIKTDQFTGPTQPYYVVLDDDFREGTIMYPTNPEAPEPPTQWDNQHWYPKMLFQQQTIEKICVSGPGCPRMPNNNYMQVYCKYKFYCKFGGCPKVLPKAYNPCSQPKWTTPDNIPSGFTITNPNTCPQSEIFAWDWYNDYITEECIERIKHHTETNPTTLSISDSKNNPKTKTLQEKEEPAPEEKKKLLQQLKLLYQHRLQLQHLCQLQLT
nr:MAG: ORF1 [TTV-like mini virus]